MIRSIRARYSSSTWEAGSESGSLIYSSATGAHSILRQPGGVDLPCFPRGRQFLYSEQPDPSNDRYESNVAGYLPDEAHASIRVEPGAASAEYSEGGPSLAHIVQVVFR